MDQLLDNGFLVNCLDKCGFMNYLVEREKPLKFQNTYLDSKLGQRDAR